MMAMRAIEKKCSLSGVDWKIYNIVFHPHNKTHTVQDIESMTLEQLLNYEEALAAISMLEQAAHADNTPK